MNEYGAQHSGCLKRIPFVDFVFWAQWVGYNLQECKKPPGERKNVCSSTKMSSASGALPPDPSPGALPPGPPLGARPPDPRYRLALPRSPIAILRAKPTLVLFSAAATGPTCPVCLCSRFLLFACLTVFIKNSFIYHRRPALMDSPFWYFDSYFVLLFKMLL